MNTYDQFLRDKDRLDAIQSVLMVMQETHDDKQMMDIFITAFHLRIDELTYMINYFASQNNFLNHPILEQRLSVLNVMVKKLEQARDLIVFT